MPSTSGRDGRDKLADDDARGIGSALKHVMALVVCVSVPACGCMHACLCERERSEGGVRRDRGRLLEFLHNNLLHKGFSSAVWFALRPTAIKEEKQTKNKKQALLPGLFAFGSCNFIQSFT